MASGVVAYDSPQPAGVVSFGNQLRQARRRQQWSQRQLGVEMYFSREYVALVERGLRAPSAAFVQRAEAALNADGELQQAYDAIRRPRAHGARPHTLRRPTAGHRGKIGTAARHLRTVTLETAAGELSPAWLTAVDDLQGLLRDELCPVEADNDVTALERRCADLGAAAGHTIGWVDVLSSSALGAADAGALLRRPLAMNHAERVSAVLAVFAALTADALLMLGHRDRAAEWYQLAAPEHRQPSTTTTGNESDSPDTAAPASLDRGASLVEPGSGSVPPRWPGPTVRHRTPKPRAARPAHAAARLHARPSRPRRRDGRAPPA
ncbi:helix-turn-helix domain-containing protein [Dactylosporangium sp. CA-152071]|uniref:helix-turn-helix domain-containing protein n=1 Tax=Dactylosporangium sp. CA-152071 TaxID=3239933 RepID=UPI003D9472D5